MRVNCDSHLCFCTLENSQIIFPSAKAYRRGCGDQHIRACSLSHVIALSLLLRVICVYNCMVDSTQRIYPSAKSSCRLCGDQCIRARSLSHVIALSILLRVICVYICMVESTQRIYPSPKSSCRLCGDQRMPKQAILQDPLFHRQKRLNRR